MKNERLGSQKVAGLQEMIWKMCKQHDDEAEFVAQLMHSLKRTKCVVAIQLATALASNEKEIDAYCKQIGEYVNGFERNVCWSLFSLIVNAKAGFVSGDRWQPLLENYSSNRIDRHKMCASQKRTLESKLRVQAEVRRLGQLGVIYGERKVDFEDGKGALRIFRENLKLFTAVRTRLELQLTQLMATCGGLNAEGGKGSAHVRTTTASHCGASYLTATHSWTKIVHIRSD